MPVAYYNSAARNSLVSQFHLEYFETFERLHNLIRLFYKKVATAKHDHIKRSHFFSVKRRCTVVSVAARCF